MNRAFSDTLVHSSNVDDQCSSQEEDDPINLSEVELKNSLKNIPPFNAAEEKINGNWPSRIIINKE